MRGRIARFASLLILFCSLLAPSVATHQASAAAALHYLYGSGSVTGGHRITLRVELTEPAPAVSTSIFPRTMRQSRFRPASG